MVTERAPIKEAVGRKAQAKGRLPYSFFGPLDSYMHCIEGDGDDGEGKTGDKMGGNSGGNGGIQADH